MNDNSPRTSEMFDLVVTNALDFLATAINELKSKPKYSVINFYTAVELILKARLLREHWSLIVFKPNEATIKKFNQGDFSSVGLIESLNRLENIVGETVSKEAKNSFDALRKHRNELVHFANPNYLQDSPDKETLFNVIAEQCRVWFYLHELLTQNWSNYFEDYENSILEYDQLMHKQNEYLEAKYDLLKNEIKKDISKGVNYIECPICRFLSAKFVSSVFRCLVCYETTDFVNIVVNDDLAYIGVVLGGEFTLSFDQAKKMLEEPNKNPLLKNADVIKPWRTGKDIAQLHESLVIDFGSMDIESAKQYQAPFDYVLKNVYPSRENARDKRMRENWWQHLSPRNTLKGKISQINRYIATPSTVKHRYFVWLDKSIIPGQHLTVICTPDSYVFGILHSKCHAVWTQLTAAKLQDITRYTPSVFSTFPFPYPIESPSDLTEQPHRLQIASLADELDIFRNAFFQKYNIHHSENREISTVTMTNLYNDLELYRSVASNEITEETWQSKTRGTISLAEVITLDRIHKELDKAVLSAYQLNPDLSDEGIAEQLLLLKTRI